MAGWGAQDEHPPPAPQGQAQGGQQAGASSAPSKQEEVRPIATTTRRRRPRPRTSDIGTRVRSVDDVGDKAKVLAYADNKVGKTTFAASAPKCLIVDINEQGTRSVKDKGTGAQYVTVDEWPEIEEVYWWLRENLKRFQSVSLDTVTAMVHLAMQYALEQRRKTGGEGKRSIQTPDQRAWGVVKDLMMPQILAYRNLPLHVVFTAQEKRWTDDDGDIEAIVPDIPGASLGITMGAVGVVGRMSKARPKRAADRDKKWPRVMLVGDHDIIKTGDRVGLPRIIKDPTMGRIITAYNN